MYEATTMRHHAIDVDEVAGRLQVDPVSLSAVLVFGVLDPGAGE